LPRQQRRAGWPAAVFEGADFSTRQKRNLARIKVEIFKRSDQAKGYVVLHKRWFVERTVAAAFWTGSQTLESRLLAAGAGRIAEAQEAHQ
jgi:hypothetical protein